MNFSAKLQEPVTLGKSFSTALSSAPVLSGESLRWFSRIVIRSNFESDTFKEPGWWFQREETKEVQIEGRSRRWLRGPWRRDPWGLERPQPAPRGLCRFVLPPLLGGLNLIPDHGCGSRTASCVFTSVHLEAVLHKEVILES